MEKIPTVLAVDDSSTVLLAIERTLRQEGVKIVTASDGLTALMRMVDDRPSLVLLDVQLKHLNGYSICQIIKKRGEFRQTPIILLTGLDGIFDWMCGRLAGATEYLTKPFEATKLIELVHKHLVGWEERVPEYQKEMQATLRHWKRHVA